MSRMLDTNVLLDILTADPRWLTWSTEQFRLAASAGPILINPIIYAELSLTFESAQALDEVIASMGLTVRQLPNAALFLAGKAFVKYRRTGGAKGNVLADFFIGAHAAVLGCGILTRDARRYKNYFPTVSLLTPDNQKPE